MEQKNMERVLQVTADGSHTLFIPEMNEHYHSVNGAWQESKYIFIEAGLHAVDKSVIHLLEIGFGTGLNALLTWKELEEVLTDKQVVYHSIELYPLSENLVSSLNYGELVWPEQKDRFQELHQAPWNQEVALSDRFILHKIEGDSNQCAFPTDIDLIYMDAFAPEKQPEMWSQPFYDKLYAHAANGAVLVTYCAKGDVRRGMQAAGFQMERLPGPPGNVISYAGGNKTNIILSVLSKCQKKSSIVAFYGYKYRNDFVQAILGELRIDVLAC